MLSSEEVALRAVLEVLETSGSVWFGPGLPELIGARCGGNVARRINGTEEVRLLVVEAACCGVDGTLPVQPTMKGERVLAVSAKSIEIAGHQLGPLRVHRWIMPLGVLAYAEGQLRVLEVAAGVSARDVQRVSAAPLVAGPDLGPVRLG